jgi:hypothetical protein
MALLKQTAQPADGVLQRRYNNTSIQLPRETIASNDRNTNYRNTNYRISRLIRKPTAIAMPTIAKGRWRTRSRV